jgi:hypothetical protein
MIIRNKFPDPIILIEFLKQKVQNQAFRKRMEQSEKDIEERRVETVTPEELFNELGINGHWDTR